MAQSTIAQPAAGSSSATQGRDLRSRAPELARHPAVLSAVGLLIVSAVIVRWANTRPGFDPYGWLVWGHQTLSLSLDTNAAPSWKPLPYLFTVPFALVGHNQFWLWMIASAALALSGAVFAGRIAYRLTAAPPERRWAAWVAAVFAGVAVLGIKDYSHYILSAQSDPVIVALTLAAIDCHLSGRRRWAFWCGVLASLGRPEAWPFLGLYGLWLWRAERAMRWQLILGVVLLLALWFGIPAISSRSFFVAGDNANKSGRAISGNRLWGVLHRFYEMNPLPVLLAALVGVGFGVRRRDRTVLALAAIIVVWVIVEIAFAYHGWPALQRYMFEAGGILIALAGVGVGRLLVAPPRLSGPAGLLGIGLVAVLVVSLIPTAVHRGQAEHHDLTAQRARTKQINRLQTIVAGLGGPARVRQCGEPLTRLEYQSTLAWVLHRNVSDIGFKYDQAVRHGNPIVLFTPYADGHGWKIQAMHQTAASCRSLPT